MGPKQPIYQGAIHFIDFLFPDRLFTAGLCHELPLAIVGFLVPQSGPKGKIKHSKATPSQVITRNVPAGTFSISCVSAIGSKADLFGH